MAIHIIQRFGIFQMVVNISYQIAIQLYDRMKRWSNGMLEKWVQRNFWQLKLIFPFLSQYSTIPSFHMDGINEMALKAVWIQDVIEFPRRCLVPSILCKGILWGFYSLSSKSYWIWLPSQATGLSDNPLSFESRSPHIWSAKDQIPQEAATWLGTHIPDSGDVL